MVNRRAAAKVESGKATAAATASSASSSAAGKGKGKSYSWRDVARHNRADDAWLAIDGVVYDVTPWLERHPGGRDALLAAAGRDVTQVFHTYHTGDAATAMLPKYAVGTLRDTELPTFPPPSPFYADAKRAVAASLRDAGVDGKNSVWCWVRYAAIFGTVAACAVAQWRLPLWAALPLAALQGFACALVGLMPLHDASHFAITHSPRVWKWVAHTHDFINGASSLVWTYQHVLGHHVYTNVDGADPDVDTAETDVRRIKRWQPWIWPYVYQAFYTPLVYGLLAWKTRAQDVVVMYWSHTDGAIRVNRPTAEQAALFWAGKAFWLCYRLVVPVALCGMPLGNALLLTTVSDFVTSYWLALTFQANHVVPAVAWPLPDPVTQRMPCDWAEMQVRTTQDYAHQSRFWTLFTGALNYQTVHHLFPGVSQVHYPLISRAVRDVCARSGVDFLYLDTGREAIGSHIAYLHQMGAKPSDADAADAANKAKKKTTKAQ